ncbi:hypothetical protein B0H16DRAFT_1718914 [Mycena metata]|uniref:Uncharacterized protein n=1 Tax=Mycena metata TaxID=1033252 RepID=A0AAD7JF85_9AGAR|nr:hypothetical protein B0H16DRAFT_1718914 [Mycena metata]
MLHITGNAPPHFSITVPPPTGSRVHAVDLARAAAGSSNVEMVDVPGPRVVPDERKARATSISSSAPSSLSTVEMVDVYPPHVFSGGSKVPENPAVTLFIFPPAIAETGSVHPFVPSVSDPDSNEWLFESSASIAEGAALGVVCWSSLYSPECSTAFTNLESKPRKPQCPTRARNQQMSFSIATASSASVGRSCTANPAEI